MALCTEGGVVRQIWHVMSTKKEGLSGKSNAGCGLHVHIMLLYNLMF